MLNNITKKLGILLIFITTAMDVFCQNLPCHKIVGKQLCHKIGQMLIIGFGGFKQDYSGKVMWDDKDSTRFNKKSIIAKHIAENNIGGVILFLNPPRDIKTGKFIRDRNIQNPAQITELNKNLQDYNNLMRHHQGLETLPLFIGVDQEGGRVDRLPVTLGFPVATLVPQSLGTKEEQVIYKTNPSINKPITTTISATEQATAIYETYLYAKKLAQEVSAAGFNLNFAPTVDVNINPTNPIIGGLGRSFSSNPQVVIDQAKQFIKASHEYQIVPVLKHFPGHGSSLGDSHIGLVDVTHTYQKDKELYPYYNLIKNGYDGMIMTTHVINGQIDKSQCKDGPQDDHTTWCPGTMSQITLTKLLREEMGFDGVIVSDDMTMGAITKEYSLSESLKGAINAGIDMLIVANNNEDQTTEIINTIANLVKNGKIEREKIDKAYSRIVNFKKKTLRTCL